MSQEPGKHKTDEVSDENLEDVSGGKLGIGEPKDKYEKEADEIADQVIGDQQTPPTPRSDAP